MCLSRRYSNSFDIADDEDGPNEPVFLVTIADKSHLTTDQPQQIHLSRIKRKLGAGLKGLSYIGMIEPGYYNVIYDELGNKRKNVVSWHGHFLVWGCYKNSSQNTWPSNKTPLYANYARSVRCP